MDEPDRAIHGGNEDTFRDTERSLRAKIERLTAENEKLLAVYKAGMRLIDNAYQDDEEFMSALAAVKGDDDANE